MATFLLPHRTLSVQSHIAAQYPWALEDIRLLFEITERNNRWEMDFLRRDLGLHWLVV